MRRARRLVRHVALAVLALRIERSSVGELEDPLQVAGVVADAAAQLQDGPDRAPAADWINLTCPLASST
jgi:hypothetical protein